MNFEKAQQLTETIHRTVEALNECCRTAVASQNPQGNTVPSGPTGFAGQGTYPMGFGWSPYRVGANPTNSTNGCVPNNASSWSGWNGYSCSNPYGTYGPTHTASPVGGSFGYPTSFGYPSWGNQGTMPWNGYAPVQTFGGTPAFSGVTGYGFSNPFLGGQPTAGFGQGFCGQSAPTAFSGWGMPFYGGPSFQEGTVPMGMWGPFPAGYYPFHGYQGFGYQGFGFPAYGNGPSGCVDTSCATHGQQTGWSANTGPTGICDVPLAA